MRVVVLHEKVDAPGAREDELDLLHEADAVVRELGALGHDPVVVAVDLDLGSALRRLREAAPEAVFNLVESLGGHARLVHAIPGLLEAEGLRYTGAGAEAMFASAFKPMAKQLLAGAGIPTPAWHTPASLRRPGARVEPVPFILKSSWEHASVGLDEDSVLVPDDAAALACALEARLPRLGGDGFAEAYVEGREFNVSLLAGPDGVETLPPAEIVFEGYAPGRRRVVGYRAKWDASSFEFAHTVRRFDLPAGDGPLAARLSAIALQCWELFEMSGYGRVDFRVDEAGRPFVLEVNTNPCIAPDAGLAAACARAGLSMRELVGRVLDAGLRAPASRA